MATDSDFYGLTRNPWPGTWSPGVDQPIILSREMRGGLRYVSGDSGDRLANITGQRLENYMLVYVNQGYVDSALAFRGDSDSDGYIDSSAGQWITDSDLFIDEGWYLFITDSARNEITGRLDNQPTNWTRVNLFFDSGDALALIDSSYIKAIIDSDYLDRFALDSAEALQLIDSDYIQGIINTDYIQGIIDSDYIQGIIDSNYINSLVDIPEQGIDSAFLDARLQVLDISTIIGTTGEENSILRSDGIGGGYWDNILLLDSDELFRIVDSAYVQSRAGLDSDAVNGAIVNLIDSAYINSRVDQPPNIDSAATIQLIDSAYVQDRAGFTQENVDSAVLESLDDIVDSAFIISIYGERLVDSNYVDGKLQALDVDDIVGTAGEDGQFLRHNGFDAYWDNTILIESDQVNAIVDSQIDSAFIVTRLPPGAEFFDSQDIFNLVDADYINSILNIVDSDYIDARLQVLDLQDVIGQTPTAANQILVTNNDFALDRPVYINADSIGFLTSSLLDSTQILDLVDSGYIFQVASQAGLGLNSDEVAIIILGPTLSQDSNQINNFDGVDSAYILERIDPGALYDSARVQNQINSDHADFITADGRYDSQGPRNILGFEYLLPEFIDSEYVSQIVNQSFINENNVVNYTTIINIIESGGGVIPTDSAINESIDSATVKLIIDADYISLYSIDSNEAITLINEFGTDSSEIRALINSDLTDFEYGQIPPFVEGVIQALDIGDIVGTNGIANYFLQADGTGGANWIEINEFLKIFDSEEVLGIVNSDYINSAIDSTTVKQFIDSNFLAQYIDSAWINSRWDSNQFLLIAGAGGGGGGGGIDSALVIQLIDTDYVNARVYFDSSDVINILERDVVSDSSIIVSEIQAQIQVLDVGDLVGNNGLAGQFLASLGTGDAEWVDGVAVDSAIVTGIVDSAYINERVTGGGSGSGVDSDAIIQLIDTDYVNARAYFDSEEVMLIIDSAVDSDYVIDKTIETITNQVSAEVQVLDVGDLIGSNGLAGQYLRSLGTGDAEWVGITDDALDSAGVIQLVDSDYINNRIDIVAAGGIDSAVAIQLIDIYGFDSTNALALIAANSIDSNDATLLIQQFSIDSVDALKLINDNAIDSAGVIFLVDSAYVSERGGGGIDSAAITQLVDSAYVVERSRDEIGAQIQATDISDIVGSTGAAGQILRSLGTGDAEWIGITDTGEVLDSDNVLQLINLNSIDSAGTLALIDSAYVSARVIFDSAEVIQLIDSAYVASRGGGIDSDLVIQLIDSAYVVERSEENTAAQIQAQDVGDVVGQSGASGQYLRSLGTGDGEWVTLSVPSFISLQYDSAIINDSATIQFKMPLAGSVTHLSMELLVDSATGGQTMGVTLFKNGATTGESFTVDAATQGRSGASTTSSTTFAANDTLALRLLPSDATILTSDHFGLIRVLTDI